MANLADIPDSLLAPTNREDFVRWLIRLPADRSTRLELVSIWTEFTNKRLTPEQYNEVQSAK